MTYQCFNQRLFATFKQPLFLGEQVNVSRYDRQKYPIFEQLIEKQLSFFWRPEEVDLSGDRADFAQLPPHEQHIFISNLKYQTLLDSIQGRSPNVALLPLVSLPELETWIETWAFSETIHSRSYTHIIRNIIPEPGAVFDDIISNPAIVERAVSVSADYDRLILLGQLYSSQGEGLYQIDGERLEVNRSALKRQIYLTLASVNVLEAIRFYVSFACSFAFAERGKMEGNAKIIKLIARDEALHLTGTQHLLKLLARGDDDPEMAEIAKACEPELIARFAQAAEQEKAWASYLFRDGSMIGLNRDILGHYVDYITNHNLQALGLPQLSPARPNPLPWMDSWLNSDHVQVAPQEVEVSSYLVGAIDADVNVAELEGFEL